MIIILGAIVIGLALFFWKQDKDFYDGCERRRKSEQRYQAKHPSQRPNSVFYTGD